MSDVSKPKYEYVQCNSCGDALSQEGQASCSLCGMPIHLYSLRRNCYYTSDELIAGHDYTSTAPLPNPEACWDPSMLTNRDIVCVACVEPHW